MRRPVGDLKILTLTKTARDGWVMDFQGELWSVEQIPLVAPTLPGGVVEYRLRRLLYNSLDGIPSDSSVHTDQD
jgi:hypothetical protein